MSAETLTETETSSQPVEPAAPRRRINPYIAGVIAIVLLAAAAGWYFYSQGYETAI
jgi:uncharacterized protein HemX